MKNILIIHTGGTFGMNPMKPDKTLHPGELESIFDKYIPITPIKEMISPPKNQIEVITEVHPLKGRVKNNQSIMRYTTYIPVTNEIEAPK